MDLECKRCDHTWMQRGESKPKACPRCNSRYWNKPLTEYWKSVRVRNEARRNNPWAEYEQRKALIWEECTSYEDYDQKIKELCKELGI